MKNRINYDGTLDLIINAVQKANEILENEEFLNELSKIDSFDYSNASGEIISNLIKESTTEVAVQLYSTLRRVNGYAIPKKPTTIFLNRKRLNRSIGSISATLVHEYIHLLDFANKEYHFGHKGNRAGKNENTAPYKIDKLVYTLLTGNTAKMIAQDDEEKMPHLDNYAG